MQKTDEIESNYKIEISEKQKEALLKLTKNKNYKESFKNILIKVNKEDGLGLYAKDNIKKDNVILSIPLEGIITIDSLFKKQSEDIQNFIIKLDLDNKQLIFSILLFLEKNNIESEWHSYFQNIWPNFQEINNCLSWNNDKINQLSKTNYIQQIKEKHNLIQKEYQQFQQEYAKNKINLSVQNIEILDQLNEQEYKYMVSIIESRSLYKQCDMDTNSKVGAIIPLYDLANHKFISQNLKIEEYFYFDSQLQKYILKAHKNYVKHEQIIIQYSSNNNLLMLQQYGFNPLNRQFNSFEIRVDIQQLINTLTLQNLSKHHLELMYQTFPHILKAMHNKYEFINSYYTFEVQIMDNVSILRWQDQVFLQCLLLQKFNLERSLHTFQLVLQNQHQPSLQLLESIFKSIQRLLFEQYLHFLENKESIKCQQQDVYQLLMQEIDDIRNMKIQKQE